MLSGGRVSQLAETFFKGGERLTKINAGNITLF